MKLVFTGSAKKELEDLPQELAALFIAHLEKMQDMPPRKHMKYGIPYHTEKATKQTRIIYKVTKRMNAGTNHTSERGIRLDKRGRTLLLERFLQGTNKKIMFR